MNVHNELLDHIFDLPVYPKRVVSLNSGFTESLFAMGHGDRIVGVSSYCSRYVDTGDRRVVGDYLSIDQTALAALDPDLIIVTSGVQRALGLKLKKLGYPVYALPLPESFVGVCDAAIRLGALTGDTSRGRELAARLTAGAAEIRSAWKGESPRVYVELWFGPHVRTIGGRTFIHDTIEIAGGRPVFGAHPGSYIELDIDAIENARPTIYLGFHEPEFVVDFSAEMKKRHWGEWARVPDIIVSDTQKGRNLIHDGPSLLETARWLQLQMSSTLAKESRST
ncbi:MAG: ABC transporter substrate-binding protein [Spirochaetaceae bacterium]|nr:MAG: ABC transporter substrate-binding protein [Spirochaetaceae bacterium]